MASFFSCQYKGSQLEEKNLTKKINIKKALIIISMTVLITIFVIYGFSKYNYCKDGDDFRLAKKNELWAIISNYDLLNTPENNSVGENFETSIIVRLDSVTQVAIIETNFEWKKIALLTNLNVDTIGWVNSKNISCAKNITKWMQERFIAEDSELIPIE